MTDSDEFYAAHYGEPMVDGPGPDHIALVAALSTLPAGQRRAMVLLVGDRLVGLAVRRHDVG